MMYEFVGKVLQVSERKGTSQKGEWKMWEVVIVHASTDQFTRKAVIRVVSRFEPVKDKNRWKKKK